MGSLSGSLSASDPRSGDLNLLPSTPVIKFRTLQDTAAVKVPVNRSVLYPGLTERFPAAIKEARRLLARCGCSARPEDYRGQQYPELVVSMVRAPAADPFHVLRREVRGLAAGVGQPGPAEHQQLFPPHLHGPNSDRASRSFEALTHFSKMTQHRWKSSTFVVFNRSRTCSLMA